MNHSICREVLFKSCKNVSGVSFDTVQMEICADVPDAPCSTASECYRHAWEALQKVVNQKANSMSCDPKRSIIIDRD